MPLSRFPKITKPHSLSPAGKFPVKLFPCSQMDVILGNSVIPIGNSPSKLLNSIMKFWSSLSSRILSGILPLNEQALA